MKVWDLENGCEVSTLQAVSNDGLELEYWQYVLAVALTPDGRRVLFGATYRTFKIWDVESGDEPRALDGDSGDVTGVAMTADGKHAITSSADKSLKVWDLEIGCELRTLERHSEAALHLAATADGRRAVSASKDKTLRVWDVQSGRELRTVTDSYTTTAVTMTPDGNTVVSGSDDGTVKVWDLADVTTSGEIGTRTRIRKHHASEVCALATTPDGNRAVSASADGTVNLWDLNTGQVLRRLDDKPFNAESIAVTADGQYASLAYRTFSIDKRENRIRGGFAVKMWQLQNGDQFAYEMNGDFLHAEILRCATDGKRAISVSDIEIAIWDVVTGRKVGSIEGSFGFERRIAIAADGRRAVSASDTSIIAWDLDSGRALRTLKGRFKSVWPARLTADGKCAIFVCGRETFALWNIADDRGLRKSTSKRSHSLWMGVAALTGDEKRMITTSWDGAVTFWDLENLTALARFHCDAPVSRCAVVDDTRILVGDSLGRVHLLCLQHPAVRTQRN